jgi:hypothetical protein
MKVICDTAMTAASMDTAVRLLLLVEDNPTLGGAELAQLITLNCSPDEADALARALAQNGVDFG